MHSESYVRVMLLKVRNYASDMFVNYCVNIACSSEESHSSHQCDSLSIDDEPDAS